MASARVFLTLIAAGALPLAGCTSFSPSEDPTALKMADLEARLIRIERVFDNQSLIELASQVEQLRQEAQSLRGEIETLRFESENAGTRQRDLYVDVDQRLQALEQGQARVSAAVAAASAPTPATQPSAAASAPSSATATPAPAPVVAVPAGNDQENYQAAFDLLRNARYEESAKAFEQFLMAFPSSPLADNAQYWLAETYYVRRQFDAALPQFQRVIDAFPDSSKIPDALLKVGFCNYELKHMDAARAALQQVARQYPDTTAARLATQRLERIAQEGG